MSSLLSRRLLVAVVFQVILFLSLFATSRAQSISPGDDTTNTMASFDREMERFMQARTIAGGALAVVKDRRLVYARGYGSADRENQAPVSPDSCFRIASLSKPITAVAILKLIEEGRLSLDSRAFDLLQILTSATTETKRDPRLRNITIQHLLNHTGGWNSKKTFDPMFRSKKIAESLHVSCPPGPKDIIHYMLTQPLDFDPGTSYTYSNCGYCVLGRVIEKLTSQSYEDYVKQHVLSPIGITRMRIGASLKNKRAEGEVCYYTANGRMRPSVFPKEANKVPEPYGSFCLEAMDAHGGWLASVVDLARFAASLDNPQHSPLLKPEIFTIMYMRPPAPVWRNRNGSPTDHYYACGWLVRPVGKEGKANYWHTGSLPGSYALLVRRWDGLSWAVLFNRRSEDPQLPNEAIDEALHRAANAVSHWPSEDLFNKYK